MQFKITHDRCLVEDLCNLISNQQIIQSLKERTDIIETILQISRDLCIFGIHDLLRYCEDALINFYAYSEELKENDQVEIWAWLYLTDSYQQYDLYTSKKIEAAYLRHFHYFKFQSNYLIDFKANFQRRTDRFQIRTSVKKIAIDQNNNSGINNNGSSGDILGSNSNNIVKSHSINNSNNKNKNKNNNNNNNKNNSNQYYPRWFWNKLYKDNEKEGWIEFSKEECQLFEQAYERGLSFVYMGETKYNISKMYSKSDNQQSPSKYLLRKPKFEPLKYYNSLSKDKYRLLQSKIKKFLSSKAQFIKQHQKSHIQQKEITSPQPIKKSITPCFQIILESVIQTVLNNNYQHIANGNIIK